MGTRGRCIAGVVVMFLALLAAPRAFAFGPDNDNIADAHNLNIAGNLPSADTGFIGFGAEPGEPDHAGHPAAESVWAKWSAPVSETLTVSMCNPNNQFDSVLEVYSGPSSGATVTNITSVAANDDGCGSSTSGGLHTSKLSRLKFNAIAGTTYYICVDRVGGTGGITYEFESGLTPSNDNFGGATLTGSPVTATGDNTWATAEAGEPQPATGIDPAVSIWWSWTAPKTDTFTIQTCNSTTTDTVLAVYTGNAFTTGITQVASNDDSCNNLRSALALSATAGTIYHIAVDGKNVGFSDFGNGPITLDISGPPANDNLANATVLTGFPTSATGDTIGASAEGPETSHAGVGPTNSIWYRWTPPADGPVTIDTCGSAVNTALSVYQGTAYPLGTAVDENDDSCGFQSSVTFDALSAQTYSIAIDGQAGFVVLNIHDATAPVVQITGAVIKQAKRLAKFTFSATDDRGGVVTFGCKMDTGAVAPCTSPVVYRRLRPGSHTFTVQGTDASGNVGTASRAFRIKR